MDEKPDQIINHIEEQRDQLGRNLNELETRVRRTTDWRTYYERNPMMILGAALGGGVLLGATLGGSSDRSTGRYYRSASKKSGVSSSAGYTGSSSHIGGTYGSASYGSPSASPQPGETTSSGSNPAASSSSGAQGLAGLGARTASWADSPHMKQISETLEQVKGALITFGIAKAKEFLAQAVPGLEEHLGSFGQPQQSSGSQGQTRQNFSGQSGQTAQQPSGNTPNQESRPQASSTFGTDRPASEQNQQTGSGTGTGANDYRSSSRGFANPGSTGTGDQYAGAGSGRNPNATP